MEAIVNGNLAQLRLIAATGHLGRESLPIRRGTFDPGKCMTIPR